MKITSKLVLAATAIIAALGLVSCEKKQVLKLYSWTYYTPTDVVADFEKEYGTMPAILDDSYITKSSDSFDVIFEIAGFKSSYQHDMKYIYLILKMAGIT